MPAGKLVRPALCALGLMVGLGHPGLAEQAQPLRATAPVYDSVVVFALPAGFQPAHEAEANGAYILELVPAGQSLTDWQEMLTLTGADDLQNTAGMTAVEVVDWALEEVARGYEAGCNLPITVETFSDAPPTGAEDAVLAYIGCPEVTGSGLAEEMILWVAAREGDLFTLQWARRGPAVREIQFDPPRWLGRYETLASMSLCRPEPGETAPYPSCLD